MTTMSPCPLSLVNLAHLRRLIAFHNEDEGSLLTDLDRRRRYQHRVLPDLQDESHIDELLRPEPPPFIVNGCAKLDGAAARLHRGVDEIEIADLRSKRIIRNAHLHLQRLIRHTPANFIQIALGCGKLNIQIVDPLDRYQRVLIGLHDITDVDSALTQASCTLSRNSVLVRLCTS